MKVLFITNVPAPYRVDFFNELGKSVDLTVVFERDNAKSRNKDWVSSNFINFKYTFLKGFKYGDDGVISFKIKKHLKQGFDIVLFGNYHTPVSIIGTKYCIKKKIAYGLSIDGIFKHENENKLKLKIKRKMFSNASFFVTSGEYSVDVIKYYGGANCYVYPFTSIHEEYVLKEPVSKKEKEELKEKLGLKKKTILFVGQMVPRKGIDILLKGYAKLKEYELVMVGGNLTGEYLELAKRLDVKPVVIPFLNSKALEEYYLASDVFVLPTREDQWGLVINEALAKGLPVVSTTACLSCYEMIKENGKIIPVEDVSSLIEAVKEILLLDEEEYRVLQEGAIQVARAFTIEKMAERHIEIFKEIIAKR